VINILVIILTITFCLSCANKDNLKWERPTKNMAQTWKEYYEKCLDENPENKEKCNELKQSYEAELESTRESAIDPETGQEPYY